MFCAPPTSTIAVAVEVAREIFLAVVVEVLPAHRLAVERAQDARELHPVEDPLPDVVAALEDVAVHQNQPLIGHAVAVEIVRARREQRAEERHEAQRREVGGGGHAHASRRPEPVLRLVDPNIAMPCARSRRRASSASSVLPPTPWPKSATGNGCLYAAVCFGTDEQELHRVAAHVAFAGLEIDVEARVGIVALRIALRYGD